MEAHAEHAHQQHEMPTEGSALTGMAVSATLHCLTGCAIGEVAGVAIGTALGFSNLGTIILAVVLAFVFGYALTSVPLLRAGLALSVVIPVALAADTLSIATMEVVDNLILVVIPGAMDAGLGTLLFWGSLAFALSVAFVLTVPVNRWLLARGKGHAAVHETGIHGGPPTKVVGAVVIVAALFGTSVLVAEAASDDGMGHGSMTTEEESPHGEHADDGAAATVPGLTAEADGLTLELDRQKVPRAEEAELSFAILGEDGEPVTDFEVEHAKRMHVIVARGDLTGFQHLHPEMSGDGTWSTPILIPDAGPYRVFADFDHDGQDVILGADLDVAGNGEAVALPPPRDTVRTEDGYEVSLDAGGASAGVDSELTFTITKDGEPVDVEPYLDADGHLVALREGDLGYLHVHPVESTGAPGTIRFMTEFPSPRSHRLFLQFRDDGEVHTAEFTLGVQS